MTEEKEEEEKGSDEGQWDGSIGWQQRQQGIPGDEWEGADRDGNGEEWGNGVVMGCVPFW